jgi:hypothetical protein
MTLCNDGEATAVIPREIRIRWEGGRLLAGDVLGGFALEDEGQHEVRVKPQRATAAVRLRPGERRPVGWLRFSHDKEVRVELVED